MSAEIETLYEQLLQQDRARINEPDGEYRDYRVIGDMVLLMREPEDFRSLLKFVNGRAELVGVWKEWVANHQLEIEWGLLPDWLLSNHSGV